MCCLCVAFFVLSSSVPVLNLPVWNGLFALWCWFQIKWNCNVSCLFNGVMLCGLLFSRRAATAFIITWKHPLQPSWGLWYNHCKPDEWIQSTVTLEDKLSMPSQWTHRLVLLLGSTSVWLAGPSRCCCTALEVFVPLAERREICGFSGEIRWLFALGALLGHFQPVDQTFSSPAFYNVSAALVRPCGPLKNIYLYINVGV